MDLMLAHLRGTRGGTWEMIAAILSARCCADMDVLPALYHLMIKDV
jgi:hypothetical protein